MNQALWRELDWADAATPSADPVVSNYLDLDIVEFCAIECRLQHSGERSVASMCRAWALAAARADSFPTTDDIIALGRAVDPRKNEHGWRRCDPKNGHPGKDWKFIPMLMEGLCDIRVLTALSPTEWFREFEEIHPLFDGNGRVGAILFSWLSGTLYDPVWPPNLWNDPRRYAGHGTERVHTTR
jgi:hypothetical protein